MSIRVRFAPSPTGALHIGGVRTALYNYLFAKKNKGTFILRIEDTDQNRWVQGAEEYIVESLRWCGIEPTEGLNYGGHYGPYRQSERKSIYYKYAHQLVGSGKAYYAFDTEEELELMRSRLSDAGVAAPKYDATVRMQMNNSLSQSPDFTASWINSGQEYVIRLLVDPGKEVKYTDMIREEVSFSSDELDDKVLIKADGMPTYHMANVIDDHLMEITHVIRGEEWLSSTAHHLLLYQAFEWTPPQFAHLPLILKPDGKGKLSKRDGAKFGFPVFPIEWKGQTDEESFTGFREFGLEPDALINFLAFLGWNPGTEQEIFTLDQLVEAFDFDQVHKGGARFDIDKALWFNQQYIKHIPVDKIVSRLKPIIESNGWTFEAATCETVVRLYLDRVQKINDIPSHAHFLFSGLDNYDREAFKKHWKPELEDKIQALVQSLADSPSFETADLELYTKEQMKNIGLKPGEVFPLFRLAIAGGLHGPTVFQMLNVLGRKGIERIGTQLQIMTKELIQ